MSEEPQATPKAEQPAADKPKPPTSGPNVMVLAGVCLGTLIAGAALGALVVGPRIAAMRAAAPATQTASADSGHEAPKKKGGHGKSGGHGKGAKSSVYRIENVIVNPAGSAGARFLMATIAFDLSDDKDEETFREHDVQLRDLVTSTLERQSLEMLTRPGARDTLKAELSRAVAPVVGDVGPFRIYLPQFVVQ